MAKYVKKSIKGVHPSKPPTGPLTGLQPMKWPRTAAVMEALDKLPGLGRRVVLQQGINGATEWLAQDTTNIPEFGTERVTMRTKARLSPGCFYDASLMYIPAGDNTDGPNGGEIKISVTWEDAAGATETDTFTFEMEPSTLTNGAEPSGAGEMWNAIRHHMISQIQPDGLDSTATLHKWTEPPVTATITITNISAPRIVDFCLFERPSAIAYEVDDSADDVVIYGHDGGTNLYPLTEVEDSGGADSDPRGGSFQLLTASEALAQHLGPLLFHWSSYDEEGTPHTDTEASPNTTTSSSFVGLVVASHTSYDATRGGWSVGNYAGLYLHQDDNLILRGKQGVVPVRVQVYGSVSGGGTGTVRIQTAAHSYVDVAITASADQWTDAIGYLECGISPEQNALAQAFFKTTAGTLSVHNVAVWFDADI